MIIRTQRLENAAIAVAIAVVFVVMSYPWWSLLALFLVFDLSALGYLGKGTNGPLFYNLVHNYVGPAALATIYAIGAALNRDLWVVGLIAGCWSFHVAADRALGYGLKTEEGFQHTHLGFIGKK